MGFHFERAHTIVIQVSPPMAAWPFLAGVTNMLASPLVTSKLIICSCSTVPTDTINEELHTQPWSLAIIQCYTVGVTQVTSALGGH